MCEAEQRKSILKLTPKTEFFDHLGHIENLNSLLSSKNRGIMISISFQMMIFCYYKRYKMSWNCKMPKNVEKIIYFLILLKCRTKEEKFACHGTN